MLVPVWGDVGYVGTGSELPSTIASIHHLGVVKYLPSSTGTGDLRKWRLVWLEPLVWAATRRFTKSSCRHQTFMMFSKLRAAS